MGNLTFIPMPREEMLPELAEEGVRLPLSAQKSGISKAMGLTLWKSKSADEIIRVLTPEVSLVCGLYMTGSLNCREISKKTGVKELRVRRILSSQVGKDECDRFRELLDKDFLAQQAKFNRVVAEAMDHPDPGVALAGANLWAKAAGKFQSNSTNILINNNISPVDLNDYKKEVKVASLSD